MNDSDKITKNEHIMCEERKIIDKLSSKLEAIETIVNEPKTKRFNIKSARIDFLGSGGSISSTYNPHDIIQQIKDILDYM